MRPLTCLFALLLPVLFTPATHAASPYLAKFGPPLVGGKYLVFSEAKWEPRRLICLDRATGKQAWELTDPNLKLQPEAIHGGQLFFSKLATEDGSQGTGLYVAELATGRAEAKPLVPYPPGTRHADSLNVSPDVLALSTHLGARDQLLFVGLPRRELRWKRDHVLKVLATGDSQILCLMGETVQRMEGENAGSYFHNLDGIAALSLPDGKPLWKRPTPPGITRSDVSAVSVPPYYIYHGGENRLACLDQTTGQEAGSAVLHPSLRPNHLVRLTLLTWKGKPLLWMNGPPGKSLAGQTMAQLELPGLQRKERLDPSWGSFRFEVHGDILPGDAGPALHAYDLETNRDLWETEPGSWHGVHAGFIYLSRHDTGGKTTSVNRIHVKTGAGTKLYEEPLPQSEQ